MGNKCPCFVEKSQKQNEFVTSEVTNCSFYTENAKGISMREQPRISKNSKKFFEFEEYEDIKQSISEILTQHQQQTWYRYETTLLQFKQQINNHLALIKNQENDLEKLEMQSLLLEFQGISLTKKISRSRYNSPFISFALNSKEQNRYLVYKTDRVESEQKEGYEFEISEFRQFPLQYLIRPNSNSCSVQAQSNNISDGSKQDQQQNQNKEEQQDQKKEEISKQNIAKNYSVYANKNQYFCGTEKQSFVLKLVMYDKSKKKDVQIGQDLIFSLFELKDQLPHQTSVMIKKNLTSDPYAQIDIKIQLIYNFKQLQDFCNTELTTRLIQIDKILSFIDKHQEFKSRKESQLDFTSGNPSRIRPTQKSDNIVSLISEHKLSENSRGEESFYDPGFYVK